MFTDLLRAMTLIAAALLGVSGIGKLTAPRGAMGALAAQGLPAGRRVARTIGLVEVLVGTAAIVTLSPWAIGALALVYGGFAAFVWRAAQRGTSCGCLGERDTTARRGHALLDLAVAVGAVILAISEPHTTVDILGDQPLSGVPFVALIATGSALAHAWLAAEVTS
jgi:hypothetical protein